jgi:hypothetical protein
VNAGSSAAAPAGVPSTATSAAGPDPASRAPIAAKVCRYFTAVLSAHALGAAWAMTKASAAWPNVGAGNDGITPASLLAAGNAYRLRMAAVDDIRGQWRVLLPARSGLPQGMGHFLRQPAKE